MEQENHSHLSQEESQDLEQYGDSQESSQFDEQILFQQNDSEGSEISQDQEKTIEICKIESNNIPEFLISFYNNYKQIDPFQYFKIPPSQEVPKSVCAKVINRKQQIIECLDCAMDSSCIICMDCFKNGNHEGHKYVAKRAGGGCCDCGDSQAWKPEGFCKNHTGQFIDFQIPKLIQVQFNTIFDGLFYYYFYARIKKLKKSQSYSQYLIKFISKLNKSSMYYNKLTALALSHKLPPNYALNNQLDKNTILENIFTFAISSQLIHQWWQTLMSLFPYYPFKMQFVKFYFQKYSLLMDGHKQAKSCATYITCQLLTSYKLIQQYCEKNTFPLAAKSNVPKNHNKLWDFFIIICHDLRLITDLTGEAPLAYWRMQINYGFNNLFQFYDLILKKIEKQKDQPETVLLSKYIHFCQIQHSLLDVMIKAIQIVSKQPHLILKWIHYCFLKLKKLPETKDMIPTLRVYHRCFIIALFKYFDCNMVNITQQSIDNLLTKLPKITTTDFYSVCKSVVRDIELTYFLYSKTMAQPGIGQSLYGFIFFYRNKNPIISYIDIVGIKILYLILNQKVFLSLRQIINYDSFDILPKTNQDLCKQQLGKKRIFYNSALKQIFYIMVTEIPQIFLTYLMKKQGCNLYSEQIYHILKGIFAEKKGKLSYDQYQKLKQAIFTNNKNAPLEKWMRQFTKFNKIRKQFELLNNVSLDDSQGINFDDIWINVPNSSNFIDPRKSLNFVSQSNIRLWQIILCDQTIFSMIIIFNKLFEKQQKFSDTSTLDKIIQFYYIGMDLGIFNIQKLFKDIIQPRKDNLNNDKAVILGLKSEKPSQNNESQKQKQNALKKKKIQEMKKKRNKFMNEKMFQQSPNKGQIQQESIECCICKNDDPQNFVYICRLDIRDHQKLLNIGPGLQCISFSSCGHIFDYKCIHKIFKKDKLVDSISCSLCKTSGNILLPFSPKQQKQVEQFTNRLTQIIFTLKQSSNLYEEIMKSFYHYAILASLDIKDCIKKRSKPYKILWEIFRANIDKKEASNLYEKFKQGKISRSFNQGLSYQPQKRDVRAFFANLLGNNAEHIFQIPTDQPLKLRKQNKQLSQTPKLLKKSSSTAVQGSQLLNLVNNWIFKKLGFDIEHEMEVQYPNFFRVSFQCNLTMKGCQFQKVHIGQNQQIKNQLFIQLPRKYTQIGKIVKCSACSQIASDLIICLICGWTGCQKCQNGYAVDHLQSYHGPVGAFLKIKDAGAIYLANRKQIRAGILYENEWKQPLRLDKDWDTYQLDENTLNKIQKSLRYDNIHIGN